MLSLLLIVPPSLLVFSFEAAAQVVFTGLVVDAGSGKVLDSVGLYHYADGRRKLAATTSAVGGFEYALSADIGQLLFSREGYREVVLQINHADGGVGRKFFLEIPLIPLDKQMHDTPYQQSQQKDYTLREGGENKREVVRKFVLRDAISGIEITKGSVCLSYTKSGKKDCLDITPDTPYQEQRFFETDIVAFYAESSGYQTYKGNLILDELDGSLKEYEIRMTPELSLYTATLAPAPTGRLTGLITSGNGETTELKFKEPGYLFGVVGPGSYQVKIKKDTAWFSQNVSILRGVNYQVVTLSSLQNVGSSSPVADEPDDQHVLYFDRGEYSLSVESMEKLDRLSAWLRENPARRVLMKGHTDNVGDPKRNKVLSEYRCRRTSGYLRQKGVGESQIRWTAEGGEKPAKPNDNELNKRWNRRVEIELIQ